VFKEYNIAAVKADYTNDNKEIGQWLRRFKRAGIPLYVILPPTNKPNKKIVVLPEILTKDMLIENLKKVAD
jgi:thiol:disulfide interchange protein DsbD